MTYIKCIFVIRAYIEKIYIENACILNIYAEAISMKVISIINYLEIFLQFFLIWGIREYSTRLKIRIEAG